MANSDDLGPVGPNRLIRLLDAAAATTSSEPWVDTADWGGDGIVHVTNSAGGTFTIQTRGSNSKAKPAASDDGTQWGSNITAVDFYDVKNPPLWIKQKLTAVAGGAVITSQLRQKRDQAGLGMP